MLLYINLSQTAIVLISDLLVNLAAGWLGAAVILPLKSKNRKLPILIFNIFFATLAMLTAFYLQQYFPWQPKF